MQTTKEVKACNIFGVMIMYAEYVREKITKLRIKKGVSEYQMSYDLGHSRGYIYNISSGRSLPPMKEFFSICEYLGVTPHDFFNEEIEQPELIRKAVTGLETLDESDVLLILTQINRLQKK
jgi:DNA-binding XRE family transcriptional regulator